MRLHHIEPRAGDGRAVALTKLVGELLDRPRSSSGPFLLAIDGRSSNGKSTLAEGIVAVVPGTEIIHTDDVAWWHSRFGWDDLLIAGIIKPLQRGDAVSFRPPAWEERDRPGAITVSNAARLVIIEGVGAGRSSLSSLVDAVIWVQSDLEVTEERNLARVAAGEIDPHGYKGWMAEEIPFLAAERTWERADVVVCGSSSINHDPSREVVVLQ